MAFTIRKGLALEQNKNTAKIECFDIPEPDEVKIQVQSSCVKVDDTVAKWQQIGQNNQMPVYSPFSGKVIEAQEQCVVIQNSFDSDSQAEIFPVLTSIRELSAEQIVERVKKAGIYNRQKPAYQDIAKASVLIVNLMETQPYLCSAHRLALEHTVEVINGAKILMKACGARKGIIAIEQNKTDAIKLLKSKIGTNGLFQIKLFKPKYPQDHYTQLIYSLTGKEIGAEQNPLDKGIAFFDGYCCADVCRGFIDGIPAVTQRITVDGDCIKTPKNLCVPIGTPLSVVAQHCGGIKDELYKIIEGGCMTGKALYSLEQTVSPHAHGYIFISRAFEKADEGDCIKCGRCARYCPMYLLPNLIAKGEAEGSSSCISCGICSYICPVNIPLTQKIQSICNTSAEDSHE